MANPFFLQDRKQSILVQTMPVQGTAKLQFKYLKDASSLHPWDASGKRCSVPVLAEPEAPVRGLWALLGY